MPKKPAKEIKLQIQSGKATPAPPVGTALGPTGVNMMSFCKEFNDKTKDNEGLVVPVVVSIYDDKSFSFVIKSPPAAVLIKKVLKLEKGSGEPNKNKVSTIKHAQLEEIAKIKQKDLNANDINAAVKIIAGTARSMGVVVEE
ncbi:50S ribosomal protein L11 [Spirochaetota bacterium]|nr:50S ribosomal protein L11 [Spirochaetota bacterium]